MLEMLINNWPKKNDSLSYTPCSKKKKKLKFKRTTQLITLKQTKQTQFF